MTPNTDYHSPAHTEKAFEERIEALQGAIRAKIPSGSALQAFSDSCKSLESTTASQKQAEDLLNALKKAKADDDLIKKAQAVLDQCAEALELMWTVETETGQRLISETDLLELEESLLECTILVQSTPKGLADFCAQDEANVKLVDEFLSNTDWMKLMLSNGGASSGNYGRAIQIHSDLLEQIRDNSTEVRRKLAIAVALEHATPIQLRFNLDQCIDPSARFWHYVNAYEKGELDSKFATFTVWELRLVVDCDAPDDELQWGRDYLKAYRPDEVISNDDRWKYIMASRTDINYHHPEHDFSNYKELLSAGGVCGARAWFGRFIAKSFGMPTWGVRQPGHAAISRWTPTGWMTCLGAAYRVSTWSENRYVGDKKQERLGLDFEEETKARANTCPCEYYKRMCLLECLAESLGETILQSIDSKECWRSLSLVQRRIFATTPKIELTENGETGPTLVQTEDKPTVPKCKTQRVVRQDKSYIVPASSFSNEPYRALLVMPSFLGGDQVHLCAAKYMGHDVDVDFNKLQDDGGVTYSIPEQIPKGFYNLSLKIVTVHRFQPVLHLSVEGFDEKFDAVDVHEIEIPNTVGAWGKTKGVKIFLNPGTVLKFSRESPCHGLTLKELVFEPVP